MKPVAILFAILINFSSVFADGFSYSKENLNFNIVENGASELEIGLLGNPCGQNEVFDLKEPNRLVVDIPKKLVRKNYSSQRINSLLVSEVKVGVHPFKTRTVVVFKPGVEFVYQVVSGLKSCRVIVSVQPKVEEADNLQIPISEEVESSPILSSIQPNVSFWSRNSKFTSSSPAGSTYFTNTELKPQVDASFTDSFSLAATARVNYFYENSEPETIDQLEVELDETYFNYLGESYNIRLGNQVIRWGKTDELSPLDNVSPEDLRSGFIRRRNERKLPVPAVNTSIYSESTEVQLIYIPWFQESLIETKDGRWSNTAYGQGAQIQEEELGYDLENGEYGLKIDYTQGSFDYSFSFLSSTIDLPTPTLALSDSDSAPVLNLDYHRNEIVGLSLATAWDSFSFRGDLAHSNSKYYLGDSLSSLKSASTELVFGFDYIGEQDFYWNIQLGTEYLHDYDDRMLGYERITNSLFGELWQDLWNNYLRLGSRCFWQIQEEESYINPYLRIKYWDELSIELGADVLDGDQSVIGQFDRNDSVYLAVTGTL